MLAAGGVGSAGSKIVVTLFFSGWKKNGIQERPLDAQNVFFSSLTDVFHVKFIVRIMIGGTFYD